MLFSKKRSGERGSSFKKAIENKDFAEIKQQIIRNPSLINVKGDDDMKTPLIWYFLKDCSLEHFRELHGCASVKFHLKDKLGSTVIHFLALHKCYEILDLLCSEENVTVNVTNKSGCTPLHFAVKGNSPECCEILIQQDKTLKFKKDKISKKIPLDYAKQLGYQECCEILAQGSSYFDRERNVYVTGSMASLVSTQRYASIPRRPLEAYPERTANANGVQDSNGSAYERLDEMAISNLNVYRTVIADNISIPSTSCRLDRCETTEREEEQSDYDN